MTPATLAAIVASRSPFLRVNATEASFTIVLTVDEGIACRFAQTDWKDTSLGGIARDLVEELGWKTVEYSAQRQVVLRCSVSTGDPGKSTCEIDRGDGFGPVSIAGA